MSNIRSLKHHLLRAAVQENVELIKRQRPSYHRAPRPLPLKLPRSLIILLMLTLAAVSTGIVVVTEGSRWASPPSLPSTREQQPPIQDVLAPSFLHSFSTTVRATTSQDFAPQPAVPPALTLPPPSSDILAAFPVTIKKIILDPGHGGEDFGAIAARGLSEKDLTLDISFRLRHLLETSAVQVKMTRAQDESVSLDQRALRANSWGGDLFVSIHVNSLTPAQLRGIETYYLGPTDDPVSLRLAQRENRSASYALSDVRQLLEGVFLNVRTQQSQKLAEAIQASLIDTLREINPALENRGVKTAPFAVLIATEMPAILTEVSCLSNREEVQLLASPAYRQQIAYALFRGIQSYATALEQSQEERKLRHEQYQ
jgi:N-acetylmuramoyl-L-alanine amidase